MRVRDTEDLQALAGDRFEVELAFQRAVDVASPIALSFASFPADPEVPSTRAPTATSAASSG